MSDRLTELFPDTKFPCEECGKDVLDCTCDDDDDDDDDDEGYKKQKV